MMVAVICVGALLGVFCGAVSMIVFGANLLIGLGFYLGVSFGVAGLAVIASLLRSESVSDAQADWPQTHLPDARRIGGGAHGFF